MSIKKIRTEVSAFEAELSKKYDCNVKLTVDITAASPDMEKLEKILNATNKVLVRELGRNAKKIDVKLGQPDKPSLIFRGAYYTIAKEQGYTIAQANELIESSLAAAQTKHNRFKKILASEAMGPTMYYNEIKTELGYE